MRSINSVAKARALSVKGSAVESVRVPNETVNMLLQVMHHICQILVSTERRNMCHVLQRIATNEVCWVDGIFTHRRFVIHGSNQDVGFVIKDTGISLDGLGGE